MKDDLHSLLAKDIQNKIAKKILYAKDCELLSIEINEKIQRQISVSTLKRFFGIIKSKFKHSKYTLDTLSQFLGFNDWQNYVDNYKENYRLNSASDIWENLNQTMLTATNQSLKLLKQKTGYNSKNFLLRDFAKKRFEDFMESPKNAMMFVAPDGYGKSSMVIQLAEHFFLDENAKYKNDSIGLVDGVIFFNLYTINSLVPLLNQFLDFKINSSIGLQFANHPELRKGRIVGIIDNVDEIVYDKVKYHRLVKNISKIITANNHNWFKLIFTCRPENREPFIYEINKNPILKSSWYDLGFTNENISNAINIPFFEKDEIEHLLIKNHIKFDFQYLVTHQKNILNIIGYPYLLFLYLEELELGNKEISEISLLQRYVQKKLNSMPYREEKRALIDRFIELGKLGEQSYSVIKNQLLYDENLKPAYEDLISKGIFYEYTDSGYLLANKVYTKFNQNIVFEYILFEKWRIDRELNVGLFFEIREFYKSNYQLQCNMLNFLARTLIYDGNFDIILQLHIEFEKRIPFINSHAQIPPCLNNLSVAVKEAFRTDTGFKEYIMTWISNSKLGKLLYT